MYNLTNIYIYIYIYIELIIEEVPSPIEYVYICTYLYTSCTLEYTTTHTHTHTPITRTPEVINCPLQRYGRNDAISPASPAASSCLLPPLQVY